jgi:signal transduction histidine kinase
MIVISNLIAKLRDLRRSSLQVRFLQRVLLPPFLILAVISIGGFLLLSLVVLTTAVNDLNRVAVSTSAKLEREFALRKSVLLSTGNEMFNIRNDYRAKQKDLQSDYEACRAFVKSNSRFTSAPGGVCESFYAQFAIASQSGKSLTLAADDGIKAESVSLTELELASVNGRLEAFKEFFPETTRMMVIDKQSEVMSKTSSIPEGDNKYLSIVQGALKKPVEALYLADGKTRQLVFAYPIKEGAVLAAYNLDHEGFLYPSWKGAPLSSDEGYVMVADTASKTGYPNVGDDSLYRKVLESDKDGHTDFNSRGIDYMAVAEPVTGTSWKVVSSSPKAIALGTLAYTQILAVAIAGVLLVSFVWVGSRFVRKTVDSILGLVSGAVIFSSGQLTYRIDPTRMSDKEFAQLADTMNNMAVKIQQAESELDQKNKEFISVATHEIKAPMTAVIGSLSMILDDGMGKVDETAHKLAEQAYKGTIRLRELVNELLDIARLESGRAKFDLVKLDLNTEVVEMIEVQKQSAIDKGITVIYQPPATPIGIVADKTKLEIILTNFISNGIKYNRPNGSVTITHEVQAGLAQITITDTGLGIPAEQQAKMFQKFFRVEGSDRTDIPGTGLGMYITKQFIEGMGGKLWFESVHGQGTSFHFTVPVATEEQTIAPVMEVEKRV